MEWISLLIKSVNLYYFYKSYGTGVISIPFKKFKIIYFIKFILSSGQDVLSHPNEPDMTPH